VLRRESEDLKMSKDFTIDQVSWHTRTPGNPEPRSSIIKRFFSIVSFLHREGLLVRQLVQDICEIDDDFAIRSSDVNETGMALLRAAYDKWLRKIDKGMDPCDVTLLERHLKAIRSQSKSKR
jgi:hypothetical protein